MWGNELQDLNFSYFTAGLGGSGPVNLLILVCSRSWMSCIFLQMTQNSVEIDTTHTTMQRNLSDLLTLTRLQGIPGRKYESFLRVLQYRWCCVWVCFTILPGLTISASGIQYQSFKMGNMHLRWWLVQRCGRWTFSWMTLGWISQHKWQSGEAKPWDAAEIAL